MPWTTTATLCSISCGGLLCLLAVACSQPETASPSPILVYCTPEAAPHARALARLVEDREVTLAPLGAQDLLKAVAGARAGDFAVFVGHGLAEELQARRLSRSPAVAVHTLGVCLVSARPLELEALADSGLRLGSGPAGGALERSLPEELRAACAPLVVHRSGRADELVRLIRLGTLDGAFVWDSPPPVAGMAILPLPREVTAVPLQVAPLSTSRLSAAESRSLLDIWRTDRAAAALANLEVLAP